MTRSVVFALLALLLTAGQASADGAWVLWTRSAFSQDGHLMERGVTDWDISRAFNTREECVRQLPLEISERVSIDEAVIKAATSGTSITFKGTKYPDGNWKDGLIEFYKCLPDTIDPRGPKGK